MRRAAICNIKTKRRTKIFLLTTLHWESKKNEQQFTYTAAHPMPCLHQAARTPDLLCCLRAPGNCANAFWMLVGLTPPLGFTMSMWFETILPYMDNMGSILPILTMASRSRGAGPECLRHLSRIRVIRYSIFLSLQKHFQIMNKWKPEEVPIDTECIWMHCNIWQISRLQTVFDTKYVPKEP